MFKRHKINNKIKTRLQNLLYLRDFEKLFSSSTVIAIFSFFSYPFQYPHTWLIFFMCVQLILFDNREKQCKIYWPSKFIVVFSSILLFSITVKEMYFENKWYLIEHKRKFGNIQEVIATYETLYPHLKKK